MVGLRGLSSFVVVVAVAASVVVVDVAVDGAVEVAVLVVVLLLVVEVEVEEDVVVDDVVDDDDVVVVTVTVSVAKAVVVAPTVNRVTVGTITELVATYVICGTVIGTVCVLTYTVVVVSEEPGTVTVTVVGSVVVDVSVTNTVFEAMLIVEVARTVDTTTVNVVNVADTVTMACATVAKTFVGPVRLKSANAPVVAAISAGNDPRDSAHCTNLLTARTPSAPPPAAPVNGPLRGLYRAQDDLSSRTLLTVRRTSERRAPHADAVTDASGYGAGRNGKYPPNPSNTATRNPHTIGRGSPGVSSRPLAASTIEGKTGRK